MMTDTISPELQKAIEKVKKLRALASNNSNENEVKAATEAANRIFSEYRLTNAMLESTGEKFEPFLRQAIYNASNRVSWKEKIISALCNEYGAAFYYQQSRNFDDFGNRKRTTEYIVCARESDWTIISYMFNYLVEEGYRLSRLNNIGGGVSFGKSYLEGFGEGVAQQFRDIRNHAKAQQKIADEILIATGQKPSAALAILDNRQKEARSYMNEVVDNLKTGTALGGARSNYSAHSKGYSDGRKVQINKGLNK